MGMSLAEALRAGAARLSGENIAFSNQADKERYNQQIKANRNDIIKYNMNKLGLTDSRGVGSGLDPEARKTLLGQ